MGIIQEYDPELKAIYVCYFDYVDLTDIMAAIEKSVALAEEYQTTRRLIDCSQLKGGERTMENYRIVNKLDEVRPSREIRTAFILPPDPATAEGLRFFETAARNRGYRARVFNTREEAVAWLLK